MGGVSSTNGGEDRCKQGLVGKPEGKRPQVRPRHRSGDNIKIYRQEVGWGGGPWTGMICLRIGTGGGLL